jgi:hypothetical protein
VSAAFTLGDVFLSMLYFFGLFLVVSLIVGVIFDVFRSPDLSGWGKAAWTLLVLVLPLVGVLIYVVARGEKMRERAARDAEANERAFSAQASTSSSAADEVAKLADLRAQGAITDDEYARLKADALLRIGPGDGRAATPVA